MFAIRNASEVFGKFSINRIRMIYAAPTSGKTTLQALAAKQGRFFFDTDYWLFTWSCIREESNLGCILYNAKHPERPCLTWLGQQIAGIVACHTDVPLVTNMHIGKPDICVTRTPQAIYDTYTARRARDGKKPRYDMEMAKSWYQSAVDWARKLDMPLFVLRENENLCDLFAETKDQQLVITRDEREEIAAMMADKAKELKILFGQRPLAAKRS